ncbi:MAG: hypothetical protein LBS11_11735 [Oscillospiraceae bacterium]|jgi:hypothetical protein|nr:hypothetical protein [Oscillospiraceae bacterium]
MSDYPLIAQAIGRNRPQKYLEIGLADASHFAGVHAPHKIGVDPVKPAVMDALMVDEGVLFFQMDAMEFLESYGELLDGLDMAFVNGLRMHHDAYKAIMTVMKSLKTDGVLFIRGCDPATAGDVGNIWQAVMTMRRVYPDWDIKASKADYGIGIITKTSEQEIKPVPEDLKKEMEKLTYEELENDWNAYADVIAPPATAAIPAASVNARKVSKSASRFAARQASIRQAAIKAAETRAARIRANQEAAVRAAETMAARKRANQEAAVRAAETMAARKEAAKESARRGADTRSRKGS